MKVYKDRGDGIQPYEFDPRDLAKAYRHLSPLIIADLALLCFADAPSYAPDPRDHARNDGRRDVWLHINNYLKLGPEQIEKIYEARGYAVHTEEEVTDG